MTKQNNTRDILTESLIFISILIVLHILLQFSFRKVLDPYKYQNLKIDQSLQSHKEEIKRLFMGHSHVKYGINSGLIDNSFNYAYQGESYIAMYFRAKNMLEKELAKPEIIFVSLGWNSFSSFLSDKIDRYNTYMSLTDYIEVGLKRNKLAFHLYLWLLKKVPYLANGWNIVFNRPSYPEKIPDLNKQGVRLYDAVWAREKTTKLDYSKVPDELKQERLQNTLQRQFTGQNYYDKYVAEYFLKFIKLCKSNNIKVIAIKFPITSLYRQGLKDYIPTNDFTQKVNSEIIQPLHLKVLDFETYLKDDYTLFIDEHHINKKGSDVISQALNNYLNNSNTLSQK